MFNKILLASDGSDHALKAAEKAVGIAQNNAAAKIDVVYVIDGSASKTDVLHNWNTDEINDQRKEKLILTERFLKKANIEYEINILHGDPGPALVRYANDHAFDIVIIGSRGLNSLQEMVLGSVSHKVAKRVTCPVLIVKM